MAEPTFDGRMAALWSDVRALPQGKARDLNLVDGGSGAMVSETLTDPVPALAQAIINSQKISLCEPETGTNA